jgi:hypothetical protein
MKKVKLKRLTLDEPAKVMPIVEKEEQQKCIGGDDGDPYSWAPPSTGTDISCAIPEVADLFRALRDSSTANLKKLTDISYEFHRRDFQVYIGGDTINVKALDAVSLSHPVISTVCSDFIKASGSRYWDNWEFNNASGTINYRSLTISVDSADRYKMVDIIQRR